MAYPAALAEALQGELGLDGTGRLLDVGCGPGSLTLLLAPLFAEAVGVDADAEMLAEASRAAVGNVRWVHMRAEDLPGGLGEFRVVTFAQSFHWMERDRVAAAVRGMLAEDGRLVHVGATTHRGVETDEPLPAPAPPRDEITALVASYLGSTRRAGAGTLPDGTPGGQDDVYRRAGFTGRRVVHVARGEVVRRSEDEVVASVFSLSSAAPHLFGDRLDGFERELRELLRRASPDGRFAEVAGEIELSIWRPSGK